MNDHNTTQHKTIEQDVMEKIRAGRVKMRPRWKFLLSSVLLGLGGVILLLTLLYITSFAIFTLRQSGVLFVPIFGMRGVFAFFAAIPLLLMLLILAFVIVLEILVRRYSFGYRRPLLVSVLAILIIVFLGGYALERTRIQYELFRQAHGPGGLPAPIGGMYRTPMHVQGVYRGTIVQFIPGGFTLIDENGAGTTTVLIDSNTRLPLGDGFSAGEEVVVFGDGASGTVRAFGIRPVQE